MKQKIRREKLTLEVDLKLKSDSPAARRYVLAAIKRELGIAFSSSGSDGWATAETGRVRLSKIS